LGKELQDLWLGRNEVMDRLEAQAVYLTVGLSRKYRGVTWPLVHAVHVVPDYDAKIDLDNL